MPWVAYEIHIPFRTNNQYESVDPDWIPENVPVGSVFTFMMRHWLSYKLPFSDILLIDSSLLNEKSSIIFYFGSRMARVMNIINKSHILNNN